MSGNRPAGVFLLAALLLVVSVSTAVRAYGGRIVISHSAAARSARTLTRRLEDEVTAELSWADSLLGGGGGGNDGISNEAIKLPNKPACIKACAAKKKGEPYTRPCENIYQCPTSPAAVI
ncbi:hypothetical protein ACQ4PT_032206 [Festuca glaucescens]